MNLYRKVVLHHFNFKQPVYDIKYSPDGRLVVVGPFKLSCFVCNCNLSEISCRHFAVTHGRRIQVWEAPGHSRDFAPFSLYCTFPGHYDDTLCIDWSHDSK